MRILNRVKKLRHFPNNMVSLVKTIGDPRVSALHKRLFILLSAGYLVWPYDLIFDVPFIGQLDDLGVFLILTSLFMARAPEEIKREHGWKDF